jgi:hypothetical protein
MITDKEREMEYKTKWYPQFSACGLNCGLCPRYHTNGSSRCPGCAGEGFLKVHPPCGVLSCCQRKGLEYCFSCDEYPCVKYNGADLKDSFITHRNQFTDIEKAKRNGLEAYKAELNTKIELFEALLRDYNDGRQKGFYCLAVNLLELQDVTSAMSRIDDEAKPQASVKAKAATAVRLLQVMADERGIMLKLRK